jgi:type I restriction enzyme M protein
VALPGQLFYSTQIPVSLWFLNRDKVNGHTRPGTDAWRDRRGEVLFIDARKLGAMVDRTHKELTNDDIARIASTYHAWRGELDAGAYEDVPGFCASAKGAQIEAHRHVLTPGRYVGNEAVVEDDEPVAEKVTRLTKELFDSFEESDRLQAKVREVIGRLDV